MAIRQRHVRQQRMRRDNLLDWWLEAAGPYSGEVVDDPSGDGIKHHLAETLPDPRYGAEHDNKVSNRLWFDSYIPLDLQDLRDSDGRSHNYQLSQGVVGVGLSPFRARRGSQTPRKIVPVIANLSARLEEAQKVFQAQQDGLDATIRESQMHGQRTTSILMELKNVKGESQRRKDGPHTEERLTEHLRKELNQYLEGQALDKPVTAAERFQAKIMSLNKKVEYADIEAALRQEKVERQSATATILRERVAQLLEELKKQDATTASLYKQVTQLKSDLEGGKEERVRLWEELKRARSRLEHPRRQMPRSPKPTLEEAATEALQLQEKLRRQDATNTSLQTQMTPLLEELEDQKTTTASLYEQVTQLQMDLDSDQGEASDLREELKRAEMAMVDVRGHISELTTLQSTTKKALQLQEDVANGIRQNVIQREKEALQQQELQSQGMPTASHGQQVAQLSEELEREEATTENTGEDIAALLEKLETAEAASEDLYDLVSQLETLQEESEEALERQEAFANDLRQRITQLDELDSTAKTAMGQQPEVAERDANTAARQMQATKLLPSLADAGYEEKSLQDRIAELTAQLTDTQVGGLADHFIVNMEAQPMEVGYLYSQVLDGSSAQHVFDMDVHLL
ncbi:hypothetical protein OQA88_5089 [Cercophora sp. LCS_1]